MADKTRASAEAEEAKATWKPRQRLHPQRRLRYNCERFVHPDDPRKAQSYRELLTAYQKGMKYRVRRGGCERGRRCPTEGRRTCAA